MVTMILLTLVMYDGNNVMSYERPVGKVYADVGACRKAANTIEGTYPGDEHFSFKITGFCLAPENMEAYGFIKGRAKLVADGTAKILEGR